MGYQVGIADALRRWGLTVVEIEGWQTRGEAVFDPRGVMVHHTGAKNRTLNAPSLRTILEGRPDLPPPLCQVLMGRDQTCYVCAGGEANHAGRGIWQPGGPGTEALTDNDHFYGLEVENNGIDEPFGVLIYDAMVRATAALLDLEGRGAEWACGHKEYARPKGRKPDPWGLDMDLFRSHVRDALEGGPMAYTLPDDREPTVREIQQILKDAGFLHSDVDGDPGPYDKSETRQAMHALKNDREAQIRKVEELKARVKELEAQPPRPPATNLTPDAVKLSNVVRGLKQLVAEAEKP